MFKVIEFMKYFSVLVITAYLTINSVPYLQHVLPTLVWITIVVRVLSAIVYNINVETAKGLTEYRDRTSASFMIWSSRFITLGYLSVLLYTQSYITSAFYIITYIMFENFLTNKKFLTDAK